MMLIWVIRTLISFLGYLQPHFFPAEAIPVKGYSLIWSDEFNGSKLDKNKWRYRGLGKRGDAVNSEKAVKLDLQGNLTISAEVKGDKLIAGMIDSEGLFSTRYGYFEARVKFNSVPGTWPAFWLQSSTNKDNGTPEFNGCEIDIFEYFPHHVKDSISHSLHWGGYGASHKVFGPYYSRLNPTSDGFHTFGLEWTDKEYNIFVDGIKTQTGQVHISKVPQFVILSLEVNEQVAGKLDRKNLPSVYLVDYVRVYKKQKDQ